MPRVIGVVTISFCILALPYLLHAQQTPPDDQPQAQPEDSNPVPVPVDPKTGLPLTPAELREREIDKYDQMKRNVNPAAKDPYAPTDRTQPAAIPDPADKTAPLPGSVADSNAQAVRQAGADPALGTGQYSSSDVLDSSTGGYTGPAVLTRSYTLARPMLPRQIKWRISLGLAYSWDDGETPVTAASGTTGFESTKTEGRIVTATLSGRHIWKHDQIGLTYAGNYSLYTGSGPSGMNHSANLDYQHIISQRLAVQLVQSLQDLSQNYSLENPTLAQGSSVANINLATSPNIQLLNSATRQSSSQASLTFQQNSRISYNVSTSYFIVGRTVGTGMTGQQVSADLNYRWTHKLTLGSYYSFTNYLYSHNVSSVNSNGLGAIASYALNSSTQLRTRFGAIRMESLAYQTVPLPPELAALLGQAATVLNTYNLRWISDISAELVKDFRRSRTASLSYAHGQSPGNGILLASVQQTISAGYAMSLFRKRLPVSTGFIYSSLESTLQGNVGYYTTDTLYLGITRHLTHNIDSSVRVDYRRYDISGSPLLAHDLRITLGLTWNQADNSDRF